jgi:hypothetical protein
MYGRVETRVAWSSKQRDLPNAVMRQHRNVGGTCCLGVRFLPLFRGVGGEMAGGGLNYFVMRPPLISSTRRCDCLIISLLVSLQARSPLRSSNASRITRFVSVRSSDLLSVHLRSFCTTHRSHEATTWRTTATAMLEKVVAMAPNATTYVLAPGQSGK